MIYRQATSNDIHVITHIHTESWRHAYRGIITDDFLDNELHEDHLAIWKKRLTDQPKNLYVLIAQENQVQGNSDQSSAAGFISVFGADHPQWGSLIYNLHVMPTMHGRGIGKELMRRSAVWMMEHYPLVSVQLEVFAGNRPAQGFYERLGGVVGERFTEPLPDGGTTNSLRYVWPSPGNLLLRVSEGN